jgi:hypothetical protein
MVSSSRDFPRGASAILPDALVRSTAGEAVRFTSGGSGTLAAARLAGEVLRSMIMVQLAKISAVILAVVIGVTSSGGLLVHSEILPRRGPDNERATETGTGHGNGDAAGHGNGDAARNPAASSFLASPTPQRFTTGLAENRLSR